MILFELLHPGEPQAIPSSVGRQRVFSWNKKEGRLIQAGTAIVAFQVKIRDLNMQVGKSRMSET